MTQWPKIFAPGTGKLCFVIQLQIVVKINILISQRPVSQLGARITPSDLDAYRVSHKFQGPNCLCRLNASGSRYAESAIYLATVGEYWDEYVAGCATDSCGYLGKSAHFVG